MKNNLYGFASLALLASLAFFSSGCAKDQSVVYRPSPQIMPSHIRKLAIRPFVNKTQQFGLEDKLTISVNNRFLTDGTYKITAIEEADGILQGEILRYIHIPVAYDSNLVATQYKLDVVVRISFVDKTTNEILWEEPNLVGAMAYPVSSLPGGMTEEQVRAIIWERLSKDILKRTISGFGAVTGESQRKIAPKVPDNSNPPTPTQP
ncbi:MAG: LptE family protein [Elusimicrobia bacterium]|nr:LptE family protein [Elusimicrobiota bacterium]